MSATTADPGRASDRLARAAAIALALGRLAIGGGLWLTPERVARALGFSGLDQRGLALARIAATRDVVLGAWQLASVGDSRELRRASTAAAVADAGDAVTFALLLTGDERTAAVRGLVGALPASLAGAWIATRAPGVI